MTWTALRAPDGTRLTLHDFGGSGAAVLLLPGLCGHAGEWSATAAWLTETHHVHALDPRGHGDSARRPGDVSREANVADAATALASIGPAVVIGQSMGGHTAFLLAARHPDLVRRLVLIEAGPQGPGADTPRTIERWLGNWPVPFPDQASAAGFLGGGQVGAAWASGLRQRDDGWYPAFDPDVMVATIAAAIGPRWSEFAQVTCPTLVVRGGTGSMDPDEFARMSEHPRVTTVEIPGAGHDVHLDSPEQWRSALDDFLAGDG